MRRLLLLRHAKTERAEPGEPDRGRKLMARGRADAPLMGAYMVHHRLIPELVLISPAVRTLETWELMAQSFGKPPQVVADGRIYNADSDALLELLRETVDARALLLIGHNPGLHDLATQLVGSGDVGMRQSLSEKLPTCGLVVIDLPLDDWSLLHNNAGRLERFVSPRLIAKASD